MNSGLSKRQKEQVLRNVRKPKSTHTNTTASMNDYYVLAPEILNECLDSVFEDLDELRKENDRNYEEFAKTIRTVLEFGERRFIKLRERSSD